MLDVLLLGMKTHLRECNSLSWIHVFLKHVILIPLNNVSENQYSLRDLKKCCHTYFSVYLPIRLLLSVYQYLKMYCSHIDTFIHVNVSTIIFEVNI